MNCSEQSISNKKKLFISIFPKYTFAMLIFTALKHNPGRRFLIIDKILQDDEVHLCWKPAVWRMLEDDFFRAPVRFPVTLVSRFEKHQLTVTEADPSPTQITGR